MHLWSWNFGQEATAQQDDCVLSSEERTHLERLRFAADRKRYLISHSNLRHILGNYLQQPAQELVFEAGVFGKPSLRHTGHELAFNLSHSASTGTLAIGLGQELGVDIEDIHTIDQAICQSYFSQSEQMEMATLTGTDWLTSFFKCWTRKEAVLKAEGSGLNINLNSFDVSLLPGAPAELLRARPDSKLTCHWRLHHFEPRPGVIGALATERSAEVACFELLEPTR